MCTGMKKLIKKGQYKENEMCTELSINDSKSLYSLTNELLDTRSGSSPQQYLVEGRLIRKPVDMANHQMSYYVKNTKKRIEGIPISSRNPHRFLDKALESWEERNE